jgi:hypothetical protein
MVTAAGTPGLYKNQCSCMFLLFFFIFAPLLPFLPSNSSNIWLYSRYILPFSCYFFIVKFFKLRRYAFCRIVARICLKCFFFQTVSRFVVREGTGKFFTNYKKALCNLLIECFELSFFGGGSLKVETSHVWLEYHKFRIQIVFSTDLDPH